MQPIRPAETAPPNNNGSAATAILLTPADCLEASPTKAEPGETAEDRPCNIGGINPDVYRHKYDVVRQHCEDLGRDYNSIIKSGEVFTHLVLPGQTPEQATAKARRDCSKLVGHEVSLEEFRQGNNFRGYPQGFIGTPREAIDTFGTLVEAGVEYFVLYQNDVVHLDTMRAFAEEVLPAFRG